MTDHQYNKWAADFCGVELCDDFDGDILIVGGQGNWNALGDMNQAMQLAEAMYADGFYYFIRPDRVAFHQADPTRLERSSKAAFSGIANLPRAIVEAAYKATEKNDEPEGT